MEHEITVTVSGIRQLQLALMTEITTSAALRAENERLRKVVDAAREVPPAWRAEIPARIGADCNAKIAASAAMVHTVARLVDALAALDAGEGKSNG